MLTNRRDHHLRGSHHSDLTSSSVEHRSTIGNSNSGSIPCVAYCARAVELMPPPCLSPGSLFVMFCVNRPSDFWSSLPWPATVPLSASAQRRAATRTARVWEFPAKPRRIRGGHGAGARPVALPGRVPDPPHREGDRDRRQHVAVRGRDVGPERGVTDAPDLEQNAMIDGKPYRAARRPPDSSGSESGDRPVSFLRLRGPARTRCKNRLRGSCFVEDISLDAELVRNGWALAHHSE